MQYRNIKLELGSLYQARSIEKVPGAQDGGVVSSLLGYALDKGVIKGAVVAGKDRFWNAHPVIMTCSSELKKHAGSIYFPIDGKELRAKVRTAVDHYRDVGIVVTPCEMRVLGIGSNNVSLDEVYLKVGLFCLGSFNPEKFWSFVGEGVKREEVKRFEIDKDLRLIDGEGKTVFRSPVYEAHKHSIPWCRKCREFVPPASDLSVGAGPEKGTCAVLLQTQRGLEIFSKALEDGVLAVAEVQTGFRERFERTMKAKKVGI